MTGNYDITLIHEDYTAGNYDDSGNEIPDLIETSVYGDKKSITRDEFYRAALTSFKPVLIVVIHPYEYEEQTLFKIDGEEGLYRVIKSYQVDSENLELTGEKV